MERTSWDAVNVRQCGHEGDCDCIDALPSRHLRIGESFVCLVIHAHVKKSFLSCVNLFKYPAHLHISVYHITNCSFIDNPRHKSLLHTERSSQLRFRYIIRVVGTKHACRLPVVDPAHHDRVHYIRHFRLLDNLEDKDREISQTEVTRVQTSARYAGCGVWGIK